MNLYTRIRRESKGRRRGPTVVTNTLLVLRLPLITVMIMIMTMVILAELLIFLTVTTGELQAAPAGRTALVERLFPLVALLITFLRQGCYTNEHLGYIII